MKADTITKDFISDPIVFADVFNYYIYGGDRVIQPKDLKESDPVKIVLPYGVKDKAVPVQRYRDGQKLYAAMTDGETEYVLYGVENQTEIHYAMAVKNNLYDALDYARQVEGTAKAHRRAMKRARDKELGAETKDTKNFPKKKPDSGEFLSGFWKEDKLIPTVTVTLYFGSEEWDGPLNLFDMMDVKDSRILSFVSDYHVHLIAPAGMSDEEIEKFETNLREVLLFIKYSKDKKKLDEILEANEKRFREVERRAVDVIEAITGSGLRYDEKEERVDVCQAIREMREESEQIGEKRGKERGEKIGELRKAQESAKNFYRMGIEIEKVAEGVGYDLKTVKGWLGLPV